MSIQKNIKKIGISLLLIGCFQTMQAQQDPQYTQYMYNTNMINPAYAG
ncbi:type IX secretion system membrane protein PorP/SprF, partial [Myroides odoratimimus]